VRIDMCAHTPGREAGSTRAASTTSDTSCVPSSTLAAPPSADRCDRMPTGRTVLTIVMVFEKTGRNGARGVVPIGLGLIALGALVALHPVWFEEFSRLSVWREHRRQKKRARPCDRALICFRVASFRPTAPGRPARWGEKGRWSEWFLPNSAGRTGGGPRIRGLLPSKVALRAILR